MRFLRTLFDAVLRRFAVRQSLRDLSLPPRADQASGRLARSGREFEDFSRRRIARLRKHTSAPTDPRSFDASDPEEPPRVPIVIRLNVPSLKNRDGRGIDGENDA